MFNFKEVKNEELNGTIGQFATGFAIGVGFIVVLT
jgi:hypothetical protein